MTQTLKKNHANLVFEVLFEGENLQLQLKRFLI